MQDRVIEDVYTEDVQGVYYHGAVPIPYDVIRISCEIQLYNLRYKSIVVILIVPCPSRRYEVVRSADNYKGVQWVTCWIT